MMTLPSLPEIHAAMLTMAVVLFISGCPRPDDGFEPNDTLATATMLELGVPITASVAQSTYDVFVVEAMAGQMILFRIESLEFEVCPLFTATGPDGAILYEEPDTRCRRFDTIEPAVQVEGASLTIIQDEAFELRIPTATDGNYYITIFEGGEVDNIFDYNWSYRLTATVE